MRDVSVFILFLVTMSFSTRSLWWFCCKSRLLVTLHNVTFYPVTCFNIKAHRLQLAFKLEFPSSCFLQSCKKLQVLLHLQINRLDLLLFFLLFSPQRINLFGLELTRLFQAVSIFEHFTWNCWNKAMHESMACLKPKQTKIFFQKLQINKCWWTAGSRQWNFRWQKKSILSIEGSHRYMCIKKVTIVKKCVYVKPSHQTVSFGVKTRS